MHPGIHLSKRIDIPEQNRLFIFLCVLFTWYLSFLRLSSLYFEAFVVSRRQLRVRQRIWPRKVKRWYYWWRFRNRRVIRWCCSWYFFWVWCRSWCWIQRQDEYQFTETYVAQLRLLEPESSKEAANSQCSFHEINLGFQPLGHGRNGVDRCNSVTSKKKRKKRSEYFCHKPVLLQTVLEICFHAGAPKARHNGCFICWKSVGIGWGWCAFRFARTPSLFSNKWWFLEVRGEMRLKPLAPHRRHPTHSSDAIMSYAILQLGTNRIH